MLFGTFFPKIDERNRFYIPRKLRSQIGKKVVIARSIEGCLCLYSLGQFKKLIETLKGRSMKLGGDHSYQRSLGRGAEESWVDKEGRVLIPRELMNHAALEEGEIILFGAIDHFEIWNPKKWKKSVKEEKEERWPFIQSMKN